MSCGLIHVLNKTGINFLTEINREFKMNRAQQTFTTFTFSQQTGKGAFVFLTKGLK